MSLKQNLINHVVILIDASGSMQGKQRDVIRVVDNQIKFLAGLSTDLDQETRVTVYTFDDTVKCVIFDKDVLRLPSIADLYRLGGRTALIDATWQAISELGQTFTLYGDHAFLVFAFTDGFENQSRRQPHHLQELLGSLGNEWTVAAQVPDINGKLAAERFGFPKGNIALWNVDSATGVEEAGQDMQTALSGYMVARSTGKKGTKNLFATNAAAVNAGSIKKAGLKPLIADDYMLVPVVPPKLEKSEGVFNKDNKLVWEISSFVERATGKPYSAGSAFYQHNKRVIIQGNKKIAVLDNRTDKVYVGDGVRALIGLPEQNTRVSPGFNKDYTIFVQSSSTNRHLDAGTRVLILK